VVFKGGGRGGLVFFGEGKDRTVSWSGLHTTCIVQCSNAHFNPLLQSAPFVLNMITGVCPPGETSSGDRVMYGVAQRKELLLGEILELRGFPERSGATSPSRMIVAEADTWVQNKPIRSKLYFLEVRWVFIPSLESAISSNHTSTRR
jgi:hypothetical protein